MFFDGPIHGKLDMKISACWKKAAGHLLLLVVLVVAVFFDTWAAMVHTWMSSATFTHGFLVVPISVWLIWDRWGSYRALAPRFDWWPLLGVLIAGFIWLLGNLANVLVVQEYAVVAMLIAGVWAVLGHDVAKRLMFPLGFLFFMVPVGRALVPPMMEFTASFTVDMLRYTGIPVYREGMYFTLSSGNWSVVEACSGVRYLIASVTLGFLYAYLTYSKLWKRALFILLSFIVPIIANGLRAYMIVMLGHLSDMKIAVGVDHLIYGWIFFGIVMAILFYIGSFWKDPDAVHPKVDARAALPDIQECQRSNLPIFFLVLALSYVAWPVSATWLRGQTLAEVPTLTSLAGSISGAWRTNPDPGWRWKPAIKDAATESITYFRDGGHVVGLYLASFGNETQGAELVNSEHLLIAPGDKRWRVVSRGKVDFDLSSGQSVDADEVVLRGFDRDLVIFKWYQVGATNTANPYLTKLLQTRKRLSGDTGAELQVILFTPAPREKYQSARERLERFSRDWLRVAK